MSEASAQNEEEPGVTVEVHGEHRATRTKSSVHRIAGKRWRIGGNLLGQPAEADPPDLWRSIGIDCQNYVISQIFAHIFRHLDIRQPRLAFLERFQTGRPAGRKSRKQAEGLRPRLSNAFEFFSSHALSLRRRLDMRCTQNRDSEKESQMTESEFICSKQRFSFINMALQIFISRGQYGKRSTDAQSGSTAQKRGRQPIRKRKTGTAGSPKPKNRKCFEIDIFRDWCKSCGICAAFCPRECIRLDEEGAPTKHRFRPVHRVRLV